MPVDSSPAARLAQRYTLQERLAVGGMGEVHLALDERLGRRVAVKVLAPGFAGSPDFVERFRREALTAAGLSHPNIAQVYDYGVDGPTHFIVMEHVAGSDLARLLRARGRLGPAEAIHIAEQVCAALAVAHRAGVVHRDIKPGNVIVRPDGTVKVTDFGIAQALGQASLTDTGTVMGTAAYVAPEQARGQAASPASDLYSLGILLFQMLTGAVPFEGDAPVAIAMRHLNEPVPLPSSRAAGIPATLDEVVIRATAKEIGDRYPDADAMAAALRRPQPAPGPATQALPLADPTSVLGGAAGTAMLPTPGATAALGAPVPHGGDYAPYPPAPSTTPSTTPSTRSDGGVGGPATRRPLNDVRRAPGRGALVWGLGAVVVALVATLAFVLLSGSGATPTAAGGTTSSATSPTPATRATTSARPDGRTVPSGVVGSQRDAAVKELISLGVSVRWVLVRSTHPEGTVLGTFPGEGEPMTRGQTVALVVSRGNAPDNANTSFVVPDGLVGTEAKAATSRLGHEDVRVTRVTIPSGDGGGRVLGTWPSAGQRTADGVVVLVVSGGGKGDSNSSSD